MFSLFGTIFTQPLIKDEKRPLAVSEMFHPAVRLKPWSKLLQSIPCPHYELQQAVFTLSLCLNTLICSQALA